MGIPSACLDPGFQLPSAESQLAALLEMWDAAAADQPIDGWPGQAEQFTGLRDVDDIVLLGLGLVPGLIHQSPEFLTDDPPKILFAYHEYEALFFHPA